MIKPRTLRQKELPGLSLMNISPTVHMAQLETNNGWSELETLPSGFAHPTVYTTGHNKTGQATIQTVHKSEWVSVRQNTYSVSVINTTEGFPVDMNEDVDIKSHADLMARGTLGLVRNNGIVCRMLDFGPSTEHPMMHRTQSLDYGIIMEGSIEMSTDDGSTIVMHKGDVMIQRGTMHAWKNPSTTEWCRVMFILINAKPLNGPDGRPMDEDLGTGGEWRKST